MRTKIEYILDAPARSARPSSPLRFEPVLDEQSHARFGAAVRDIIAGSMDHADRAATQSGNIDAQTRRLAEPDEGFTYSREWWSLVYNDGGAFVGLSQPVLFKGCEKDGLQEGTIHYIGVTPEHRGHGYIDAILRFTTWTLSEIGVWRIYADTDERNTPMRRAFLKAGYREGRSREVPDRR